MPEFKYKYEKKNWGGVDLVRTAITTDGRTVAEFGAHLNASNCGITELHYLNVYSRHGCSTEEIYTELARHMLEVTSMLYLVQ